MRRVLMLSVEFPPLGGGASKVVGGLTDNLVKSGHEVDLVTMGFKGLSERETVHGVDVHRVRCLRRSISTCRVHEIASYLLPALLASRKLSRHRRYDLVHAHFLVPDGLVALRAGRTLDVPVIVTVHGSDVPGYNPDRFRRLHKVIAPKWRRLARATARIACPSRYLEGLLLAAAADVRTTVIPNGIDLQKYRPDRPEQERVLVVTRLFKRKGVQYLLRALEGIDLGWEVAIAGTGPYLPALEEMSRRTQTTVRFKGWLDNESAELRDLYETSAIFVLPSLVENFPLVLLEAMTAGMAVVTTNTAGCREVVGDAALTVPPEDSEAIREALLKLLGDPQLRRHLGQAARQRVEERFSWQAVGRQYAALYEETISERRVGW